MSRAFAWVLFGAALAALCLKLSLAQTTYGTNDLRAYWFFLQESWGVGVRSLYLQDVEFNHPPFVLRWLAGLRQLGMALGSHPRFWFRLPSIVADLAGVLLLAKLLRPEIGRVSARTGLLLVALAPAAVFVSGFHGNNDPVMIGLVLASVFLLERSEPDALAGLAMGMAINFKVVPIVLWPAVFLWLPSWRRRAVYFGAAVLAVAVASAPILFQEPLLVARKVLGYASQPGIWGLGRIAQVSPGIAAFYESWGRLLLVASLVGLSIWMNVGPRKPGPYRQVGLLVFAFLALTPGFGIQYLAWLVPWIPGIGAGAGLAVTLSCGAFLGLVYTYWCQGVPEALADPNWLSATFWERGLPWNYADGNAILHWRGAIVPVEILCWITVVAGFAVQLRRAALERRG